MQLYENIYGVMILPLCMFRYAFNFSLRLPEEIGFITQLEEREAVIRCINLEGEKLFSFKKSNYNWLNSEESLMELTAYSMNKNDDKLTARVVRFYKDHGFFSGGVIDPVKYTICEVAFKVKNTKLLEDDSTLTDLKNWANKIIVKFINTYRLVTQETTIPSLLINDSPLIEIWVSDDENIDWPDISANYQILTCNLHWNDPFKQGYNTNSLSTEKINLLSNTLRSAVQVSLYDQLLLDAKEQAHIRGNYDLCIVLSETAFEVFLHKLLINICDEKGIKVLQVGRDKKEKDYQEVITNSNVRDLITKYLKEFLGNNLAETKEYNKWYNDAYIIRNDIVHKGKIGSTSEQAEKAFMSVVNFCEAIRKAHKEICKPE